jgi:hypothetical protein
MRLRDSWLRATLWSCVLGASVAALGCQGAVHEPGGGGTGTPTPGGNGDTTPTPPPVGQPDGGTLPDPGSTPSTPCGTTASIASLLSQYGDDSTHWDKTPMGTRFEAVLGALPLSAQKAAFLADPAANPTVSDATEATDLVWHPVAMTLFPSGDPSPADIMQHAIGDCDGDSAMASMAYMNPQLVKSLIHDNHDGTYAVAMFDPAGKPISVLVDSTVLVDPSDATSLGAVSGKQGNGDWATVLEKAVMKYDAAYGTVGQIDGIGSEVLIPMFTGNGDSLAIGPGKLTAAQLQQVVMVSLAAGKLITGGFNQELPIGQDQTVTAHGYAVMVPTDPATDLADMRNPWGVSPWASMGGFDTSADGVIHVPMASAPTDWTRIIDLRIIEPGASCVGQVKPYVPRPTLLPAAIRIREPHMHVHRHVR